jgi:hypothetical protein
MDKEISLIVQRRFLEFQNSVSKELFYGNFLSLDQVIEFQLETDHLGDLAIQVAQRIHDRSILFKKT